MNYSFYSQYQLQTASRAGEAEKGEWTISIQFAVGYVIHQTFYHK